MQKHRVSMTVEIFGFDGWLARPDGFVTREVAKQLGIDYDAGWRMTDVETLVGSLGPGRSTVKLVRDVLFDITKQS